MAEDFMTDDQDRGHNAMNDALAEGEMNYVATDEKRTLSSGTLMMGGLIALAAVGIYFMRTQFGPAAAMGDTGSGATINRFLTGGEQQIKHMERLLDDTQQVVQKFVDYPAVTQVPLDELGKNPFHHVRKKVEDDKPIAKGPSPTEAQLAKQRAEAKKKAVGEARDIARKLQTVMTGANPSCLIDGEMYGVGDKIGSFKIEQIKSDRIIVGNGTFRFALKLTGGR